jgi:hypothetical protein
MLAEQKKACFKQNLLEKAVQMSSKELADLRLPWQRKKGICAQGQKGWSHRMGARKLA